MYNDIKISIKNTKEELKSFPIEQSLTLEFSERVEDSYLDNYIYIIQALDSGSLIHIGDTYNQNVGIVKEDFKPLAIKFEIVQADPFTVKVKPVQPLTPGYSYTLLVKEDLPTEYLSISKTVSYSSSTLGLISAPTDVEEDLKLTIESDSQLNNQKHIVQISFKGVTRTLDITKVKTVNLNGYTFNFNSDFYLEGEEFTTTVVAKTSKVQASFAVSFQAANSKNIKPVDNPNKLLTEDLISDFNNTDKEEPTVSTTYDATTLSYTIEHTGEDSFVVVFNQEVTNLLDLDQFAFTTREAYKMYTLKSLGLYDKTKEYKITYEILSETEVEFKIEEVVYEDLL